MKKLSILLAVLTMFSCSNDDDNAQLADKSGNIMGKWYYKEMKINGNVIPYDDHEACGKDYIEFYDTNKIKSVDIWDCEEDVDWTGTFSKDKNFITLNILGQTNVVEVMELSEHVFSYVYDADETGDGISEQYIATFER